MPTTAEPAPAPSPAPAPAPAPADHATIGAPMLDGSSDAPGSDASDPALPDLANPTPEPLDPPVDEGSAGGPDAPPAQPGDGPRPEKPDAVPADAGGFPGVPSLDAASGGGEPNDLIYDVTTQPSTLYADLSDPHGLQSDGAYRYAYPIEMPAYRGLEPAITLNYASLGRPPGVDSVLGSGWRIGGLSKIERVAPDGSVPPLEGYGSSIVQRDGIELLLCSRADNTSASCSSGGTHAPLQEDYTRIKFVGELGTEDSKFLIWRPDGTRLTYETLGKAGGIPLTDAEGYDANENRTILFKNTWLLTRIENTQSDRSSVYIRYAVGSSREEGYAYRMTSIEYGGSEGYEVVFGYERMDNPIAEFATGKFYRTGGSILDPGAETVLQEFPLGKQHHRLRTIHIKQGDSTVRAYAIRHAFAEAGTDSHFVTGIQEYGRDVALSGGAVTGGSRLPQTTFNYYAARDFTSDERKVGQGLLLGTIRNARGGLTRIGYLRSNDPTVVADGKAIAVDDQIDETRWLVRSVQVETAAARGAGPTTASSTGARTRSTSGRWASTRCGPPCPRSAGRRSGPTSSARTATTACARTASCTTGTTSSAAIGSRVSSTTTPSSRPATARSVCKSSACGGPRGRAAPRRRA